MNCRIRRQAYSPISAAAQNQASTCKALPRPFSVFALFFSVNPLSMSKRGDCREPSHLQVAARKREPGKGLRFAGAHL